MAHITSSGIEFFPLWWCHHDAWQYQPAPPYGPVYDHWGHVHLFMLGYNWDGSDPDAFRGAQTWSFQIKDEWGPRSFDPNQNHPYTIVGTPKWYFHVQELWRRVYIQRWDEHVDTGDPTSLLAAGRKGIRWDACPDDMKLGPFREANGFSPLHIMGNRTLPIEYFTDESKDRTHRNNYCKVRAAQMYAEAELPFDPTSMDMNHGPMVYAQTPTWPDSLYIHPTMEYQRVIQLDWERLPGAPESGDGWSQQISLPYKSPITGTYNSPFGPTEHVCRPAGEYFGSNSKGPLVTAGNRLAYRDRVTDGTQADAALGPLGMPVEKAGQPVVWSDPYNVGDGRWVQQCLGGIVQVRAEVTLQHRLGGTQTQWIDVTQYIPSTPFEGTDR